MNPPMISNRSIQGRRPAPWPAAAVALGLLLSASAVLAQNNNKPSGAARVVAKPAPKTPVRTVGQSATKAPTPAEAPVTPEQMAVAELVQLGRLPCELGQTVHLSAELPPGHFRMQLGAAVYRLVPVPSRTGAVRLEDPKAGVVWLQLANKSMLMSQKLGRRLADECMSPTQLATAEAMKGRPAVNLLEPEPVAPAASVAQVPAPVAPANGAPAVPAPVVLAQEVETRSLEPKEAGCVAQRTPAALEQAAAPGSTESRC